MNRHILSAMITVSAIGLVLISSPAMAAEDRPFRGGYEATLSAFDQQDLVYAAEGTGTHVGDFSAESRVRIKSNAKAATAAGSITIAAATGELLYIVFEQTWDANTASYVGPYFIVGGTGRFANAGGSGILVASSVGGGVTVVFDGTINF